MMPRRRPALVGILLRGETWLGPCLCDTQVQGCALAAGGESAREGGEYFVLVSVMSARQMVFALSFRSAPRPRGWLVSSFQMHPRPAALHQP